MDAAIAGLIGSLGGVVIGAAAQATQARRHRKWQVADRAADREHVQAERLWQERRVVYAAFMDAASEVMRRLNWSRMLRANPPTGQGIDAGRVLEATTEALKATEEAIHVVSRRSEEVLLLTQSDEVATAVRQFMAAVSAFDLSESLAADASAIPEGLTMIMELASFYRRVTAAAREELGIRGSGLPSQRSQGGDE
ncbi:hypothetical protein ACN6LI_004737 [Streptomyces violaceoruber]